MSPVSATIEPMGFRRNNIAAGVVAGILLSLGSPVFAHAAKPAPGPSKGGGGTTTQTGNDISWPQCKKLKSLPSGQAFGIVGVNHGRANDTNTCLAQELTWAGKSTGKTRQPKVAVYANTGNPGDVSPAVADWPTSNRDIVNATITDSDPYGTCTGANTAACAWQYGYNMANADVADRGVPNLGSYRWYLDVETTNSWSANLANNAADLEGMVAFFRGISVTVGLYSTSYQWNQIVGSYDSSADITGNSLDGLISWLPGASSQSGATAMCKQPPLTAGGTVALTQYVSGQFDYNVSCQ